MDNGVIDVNAAELQNQAGQIRLRSPYSDKNQFVLDRVAADVYLDMGLISDEDHAKSSEEETIEILSKIPDLQGNQAVEFSERFIDKIVNNEDLFRMVPPMTLANAYVGTKERIAAGDGDMDALNTRLARLSARIDELSNHFWTYSGYFFADPTNIADAYDGYIYMMDVRRADLNAARDADRFKIRQIEENKQKLEEFIAEYDRQWGLNNITPDDAKKLSKRWDELIQRVGNVQISDETLYLASKYKFIDENGNAIPQFIDANGNKVLEHARGVSLDPDGRLARVIDLARHDVAMQNLGDVDEEIDDEDLENEVNERIPFKLFEIDTADRVVHDAQENPKQFTDPKYLNDFIDGLSNGEGSISNEGYQAAMDAQVNQTGGFCGRLKSKLKDKADSAKGLFGKIFKPLRDIDKRKNSRDQDTDVKDKRAKRIDMFVRILKGLGSAFLISAAITTIATAAAATAGISLAASMATIGIVTGIVTSYVQISKWRARQKEAGKPAGIKEFLKDKRMMATMGTTALASVAMVFGAAGLQEVAMVMGYGALAIGGSSNAIAMYKDAKKNGFSTKESITWAIANAVAVLGGGIAGRATANAGIATYNEHNPTNELFQTKEVAHEMRMAERTETTTTYTDDALRNAERITKMWYADNPTELQHRVDMVNAYNAQHGTHIDPYRAIMLSADAGGQTFDNMALHVDGGGVIHSGGRHTVLTDFWGSEHGMNSDELHALRDMFTGNQINPDAMNAAIKADHMVSANNEVGVVSHGDTPHYDGALHQNTVDANGMSVFNTYAGGDSVFHTTTQTIVDNIPVDITTYKPVNVPWGAGMFGVSYAPMKTGHKEKPRVGALLDRVDEIDEPQPEPVPPVLPEPPREEPEPVPPVQPEPPREEPEPVPPVQPEPPREEPVPVPPVQPEPPREEPEPERQQILNLTRAQAKKLDELPVQIAAIKEKRQSGLKKSEADKLFAQQKKLEQELRTLINKLGRPTDAELQEAKADAYHRYDLKNALDEMAKLEQQRAGYQAHKDNRSHYDGEILDRQIARLNHRIADLGGAESLDDTSYLRDPVPFKPDYSRPENADVVQENTPQKKRSLAGKFRDGAQTVRSMVKDQFVMGAELDADLTRAQLDREYNRDRQDQDKLRRRHLQQLAQMGHITSGEKD
ncbi:hypothetical protein HDR61_01930 [bacterium]|nr:hypothetical protein [bacterium]